MRRITIGLLALSIFAGALPAAEPPEYVNYQGVLRDADGNPLDGDYDMEFHFYDSQFGGNRLLSDIHRSSEPAGPVTVTGGLFNVRLGGGTIDPGTHATLGEAFGDRSSVWLEVEIEKPPQPAELLEPRIRVIAAPYALNAGRLDGRDAGSFLDTSSTTQTKQGKLLLDSSSVPGEYSVEGRGVEGGGYFLDSDDSGKAWVGTGDFGIIARGNATGALFMDNDSSGYAYVAFGDGGIFAAGDEAGGVFQDLDDSGQGYVGIGHHGIEAAGNLAGGWFVDLDDQSFALVASGENGIEGVGKTTGGLFEVLAGSGQARVADGEIGIDAGGNLAGGTFQDYDGSGYAWVGIGDKGIEAYGGGMAGRFEDTDGTSEAKLAWGTSGVWAAGTLTGGHFEDLDGTGYANVGFGDWGLQAYGGTVTDGGGVYAHDVSSGTFGRLAWGSSSTSGNGSKNFVQNHPDDPERVILYAAPEGDEVATYTRGKGRLVNGEARVALGETFRWVTNPDIGLTAHLTPRGDGSVLYVDTLTTEELVVRSLPGFADDVSFDYLVFGLRIGFEEASVVQEKRREAYIPSMETHRARYERAPELRRYNPLERFKKMRSATGESAEPDLTASIALRAAIHEYDPQNDRPLDLEPRQTEPAAVSEVPLDRAEESTREHTSAPVASAGVPLDEEGNVYGRSFRPSSADLASLVTVSTPVEAGDVLVIDPEQPGRMSRSSVASDSRVFGIVASEPGVVLGFEPAADTTEAETRRVAVVSSGVARCKVDAGYGAIRAGDLLTTSPTPGHAMRDDDPQPGSLLGKAIEPLEFGSGVIKILVTLR